MSGKSAANLSKLLAFLLDSDSIRVISTLWKLLLRIFSYYASENPYVVIKHEAELELLDPEGATAIYRKRQKVRFLQNNVIAYQDQAWGDGDIFADYKVSPGVAVDRYREGHLHHVLISLRGARHRGDVEEFHIQRTIKNGFLEPVETFQVEINHKTRQLSLRLIFPPDCYPQSVRLIEQNFNRAQVLDGAHRRTLPDGRHQFEWHTNRPRLFESYILRWEWHER